MKRKEIFLSSLIILFMASFFFSFFVALKVILMGGLILASFLYNPFREKIKLLRERKYIVFMIAFAVWMLTSFALSENQTDGWRSLQLRLPLILFPISMGLIHIPNQVRNQILLAIAAIVVFASIICLIWSINKTLQTGNTAWLYNDALSTVIGQQSIHTSLLVNLSIYTLTYHYFYDTQWRKLKPYLLAAIVFLFIISYLLASRNMMLILYISTLIFSFYFILTKKKYIQGAGILLGLISVAIVIWKVFPQTINRFRELAYTQFDFQSQAKESHYAGTLTRNQWNGANFRLAAWQCGWEIFKEHPIKGVDLGDKNDALLSVYTQKKFQFAIDTRKNVHNNYLDILYSMGVAGLVLFLTGWILLPLIKTLANRDRLAALIILTFAIAMVTENYFDRSMSALLFGFFIPFLMAGSSNTLPVKSNDYPGYKGR
jgi:O-antigen ligase